MPDLRNAVGYRYDEEGVTLRSQLDDHYDDGTVTENQGWTTVETLLVRFNKNSATSGRFPVEFNLTWPGKYGLTTRMGYDAVVCVQKYEPWIVEAYNTSTSSPSALRIVGAGNGSISLSPDGKIRRAPITDTTRYLNATGKYPAFAVAHLISMNQLEKLFTGQLGPHYPSPTVGPVMPRV